MWKQRFGKRERKKHNLKPISEEQVEEIYLECSGCGKKYLLQEEETNLISLTCDRCGLIIIL